MGAGMDPMMRRLHDEGFDIEWHIVVMGTDVDRASFGRYAALAAATGGTVVAIPGAFDEESPQVERFLNAVEESNDENARRDRQQQYLADAQRGKTERFEWF